MPITMNPKFSIITASYNQAEFLERTILSIINQSYKNYELIIIDGGSTDSSVDIIKKYQRNVAYWVCEKDRGQTHAINKGFAKATGDFVCFQNSDDIFLPGAFEEFANAIVAHSNYDLFYGDHKHIDKDDNILDIHKLMPVNFFSQIIRGPFIHNQACFWRRDIFDVIGFLDESYQFDMDYEFFTRVLYYGYKAKHIPKYLGAFRHHDDAKTSTLQDVQILEKRKVKEFYKSKKIITRLIPSPIGGMMVTLMKVLYHIVNSDIAYVYRHRLQKRK